MPSRRWVLPTPVGPKTEQRIEAARTIGHHLSGRVCHPVSSPHDERLQPAEGTTVVAAGCRCGFRLISCRFINHGAMRHVVGSCVGRRAFVAIELQRHRPSQHTRAGGIDLPPARSSGANPAGTHCEKVSAAPRRPAPIEPRRRTRVRSALGPQHCGQGGSQSRDDFRIACCHFLQSRQRVTRSSTIPPRRWDSLSPTMSEGGYQDEGEETNPLKAKPLVTRRARLYGC